MGRHPQLSAGPAGLAGAAQEEHLLLLLNATPAGLLLEHIYMLVYICRQRVLTTAGKPLQHSP